MERQDLAELMKSVVKKNAAFPITSVSDDDLVTGDLGLDSLGLLMSLSDLEDRLHFTFPVERLGDVKSLRFGAFVDLVRTVLYEGSPGP